MVDTRRPTELTTLIQEGNVSAIKALRFSNVCSADLDAARTSNVRYIRKYIYNTLKGMGTVSELPSSLQPHTTTPNIGKAATLQALQDNPGDEYFKLNYDNHYRRGVVPDDFRDITKIRSIIDNFMKKMANLGPNEYECELNSRLLRILLVCERKYAFEPDDYKDLVIYSLQKRSKICVAWGLCRLSKPPEIRENIGTGENLEKREKVEKITEELLKLKYKGKSLVYTYMAALSIVETDIHLGDEEMIAAYYPVEWDILKPRANESRELFVFRFIALHRAVNLFFESEEILSPVGLDETLKLYPLRLWLSLTYFRKPVLNLKDNLDNTGEILDIKCSIQSWQILKRVLAKLPDKKEYEPLTSCNLLPLIPLYTSSFCALDADKLSWWKVIATITLLVAQIAGLAVLWFSSPS